MTRRVYAEGGAYEVLPTNTNWIEFYLAVNLTIEEELGSNRLWWWWWYNGGNDTNIELVPSDSLLCGFDTDESRIEILKTGVCGRSGTKGFGGVELVIEQMSVVVGRSGVVRKVDTVWRPLTLLAMVPRDVMKGQGPPIVLDEDPIVCVVLVKGLLFGGRDSGRRRRTREGH